MEIKSVFLHHIDVQNKKVTPITIDGTSDNLNDYVESLVKDIQDNPNRRLYEFKEGSTQVKASLVPILNEEKDVEKLVEQNADRLLEKEIKVQKQIAHLAVEIQKGSLLHLNFTSENLNKLIICKVEHDEILTEDSFDLKRGLNTRKKLFKAILVYFDSDNNITFNYVNDKNSSKYWWDDFLELNQLTTDEKNTEDSLNEIDKSITKYRKKYYADHFLIRNTLIGYYRNNNNFNFSDLMSSVFENYTPVNPDFPIKEVITRVRELPQKKSFDTQFTIIKKKINKKIKTRIRLHANLYLNVDDFVNNLKNILEPIEENGNKYVRILSTEGFEKLKDLALKEENGNK